MADTIRYVGDTDPSIYLQVSDETGVLDLSGATAIELIAVGASYQFSGAAVAQHPPIADADGVHQWNVIYNLASGDTAHADTYNLYVKVTEASGRIMTYGVSTLQVKPVA